MKTLYIVRHAKSSWDLPVDDVDRPLNKRGERDAPEMGRRLKARGISPDLMLSSPATRALMTCNAMAKALNYAKSVKISDGIYHATENQLLQIIRNTDDIILSLMICGHNPSFTGLANRLTKAAIDNMPTCSVVACTFDVDRWSAINFGEGKLLFYDYPKKKI